MTDLARGLRPAIRWQTAVVTEIVQQTPRIKSFTFELAAPFAFEAGQHVDLRLTAADGYRAMRSYSIGSAPGIVSRIEIAIEHLPGGEVSDFFHTVLRAGDRVELRGPLGGHFVWNAGDGGPLLLVGGASGVVPLMSMLRHRTLAAPKVFVGLLFSARTWDDVLYRDELLQLAARHDGFSLALTLTRERPRRAEDYGRRVDARMMAALIEPLPGFPKLVYICGSNAFVNAASDAALAADVSPAVIRTERYGV